MREPPILLDLFAGAGGAAMGYHRAGFRVVGVDWKPQPQYPFEFILADAMTFPLQGWDAIHASPPCQGYSIMRNLPWLRDKDYPLLIEPIRERLIAAAVPYIIENVAGARRSKCRPDGMRAGWLCGGMFGLPFYRHRYFETNWFWWQPGHPQHHRLASNVRGGRARARNGARRVGANVGHSAGVGLARAAMGIPWMTRDEITQAIPPAYTEYIGRALMEEVRSENDGARQEALWPG